MSLNALVAYYSPLTPVSPSTNSSTNEPTPHTQFLRDWLTREGLKGQEDVAMPAEIVSRTHEKYVEAFERVTGRKWGAGAA